MVMNFSKRQTFDTSSCSEESLNKKVSYASDKVAVELLRFLRVSRLAGEFRM